MHVCWSDQFLEYISSDCTMISSFSRYFTIFHQIITNSHTFATLLSCSRSHTENKAVFPPKWVMKIIKLKLQPTAKNNCMPVPSVSSASVHYLVSDVAAAAIASSIVKDLIAAGHHSQSISYLSVDPNKTRRGKENRWAESYWRKYYWYMYHMMERRFSQKY